MRRRILAVGTVVLSTLAACRDVTIPTGPPSLARAPQAANRIVTPAEVESLINALFGDPSHRESVLSQWKNIVRELASTSVNQSSLESHVNNIVKFTLEDLALGSLLDPDATGPLIPATGATRLLGWVFEYSGVYPTELPPAPAGTDIAIAFVDPTATGNQTFVTSLGDGAAVVPPGAFQDTALLVMVRMPEEPFVNTPYPKLSRTFDVSLAPQVDFAELAVLLCPLSGVDHEVSERAVIAHQLNQTTVEYLERATYGGIMCPSDIASAWREERGTLRQRLGQLASFADAALKLVAPKPLYAGHAAIGGVLTELSPLVAVDPIVGTAISASVSPTTYGGTATVTAALGVVAGAPAHAGEPVAGASLLASVDGGSPVAATTDANGVTQWQFADLGAGSHSVTVSFAGMEVPANAPLYGASSATAPFSVAPAPLTLVANDASRAYGQPNPTFTGSVSGVLAGDDITLSFQTVATISSLPGTYDIVPVVSGADLVNYYVVQPVTKGTLTVEKIPLTVSVAGGTYVYGQNACTLTYSTAVNTAWLTGTAQCLVNGSPLANPAPVGTYTVTPGGLTSAIYAITYAPATVSVIYNPNVGHMFISPIPNSQYQQGRSIPAKFQLFMADGVTPVTNAVATASFTSGAYSLTLSPNLFVFNGRSGSYHLNIDLPRDIPVGTYTLTAHLNDGTTISTTVAILPK